MKYIQLSIIMNIIILFVLNQSILVSSIPIDTNEYYIRIIEIGHFNDDQALDTLIGVAGDDLNFKPRFIYWGNDTNSTIPDSLKLDFLEFNYPKKWIFSFVASNIDYLNNDTLLDLGLFIGARFVDSTIVTGDSLRDTVFKLIVFGQKGLDTIPNIDLMEIDTFQVSPFLAMHMRYGHELINPMYRELSEYVSYEFKTIDLNIEDTSVTPPPLIRTNINFSDSDYNIKFYPNPVTDMANLEISGLSIGDYTISIYNAIASNKFQKHLFINNSVNFIKQINLKDITSGRYYLYIEGNNKKIGPIQFVIIK